MRRAIVIWVLVTLLNASLALAQPRESTPPRESISVGAAAALGVLGNVAALRVSGPAHERWGVDLTVGHVSGHGSQSSSGLGGGSVAAQARWLWHGRRGSGLSTYWIAGPMLQMGTERTEIRWPDGRRDVLIEGVANFTLQVGYGVDRLTGRGTRFGVELTTGGNERGPTMMAMAFAVWGPPR